MFSQVSDVAHGHLVLFQIPSMNNLRFCEPLQEMIVRMLAFDPAKRPDAATLYDEVSRHRCQNLNPPQRRHKTTQVFAHSTAMPGPNGKGVFLSSQRSAISTISQDTGKTFTVQNLSFQAFADLKFRGALQF